MAASVSEAILASVKAVLEAANTSAGVRVSRSREEPYSAGEVPAIKIRRLRTPHKRAGGEIDEITLEFGVEHHVRGEAWETLADALHMETHPVLLADGTLNTPARYLRLVDTQTEADPGDQVAGRLVAIYEVRVVVARTDLTVALN